MRRIPLTARTLWGVGVVAMGLGLSGCATSSPNAARYDAQLSAPLAPDQARVCFVRQSAMLGAIVPHTVVDSGSDGAGDIGFIDTSCWVPVSEQTLKEFFPPAIKMGMWIIESAAGREVARDKPVFFTMGPASESVPPNTDWMDAAYLVLPDEILRRTGLSGTPIVTGRDYLWGVSEDDVQPRFFVRLPALGGYQLDSARRIKQISGVEALKLMGQEVGQNARYLGTVRSGGSFVFDRPAGTLKLRVVTPGGDTAYAPDFVVEPGKKYVVVYTYGFSGVHFTLTERP